MRKRKIKKYGGSYCIHLSKEDIIDYKIKEGDYIDIEDIYKIKRSKKNER